MIDDEKTKARESNIEINKIANTQQKRARLAIE